MKNNLILFFFLPVLVFGQLVNPINNSNSKWYVAATYPNANAQNPNFVETKTTIYGFVGDSLLNGISWKKLYATNDSNFANALTFQGLIRTESKRVLLLDAKSVIDTLYDFNLHVGDSVSYLFYGQYLRKIAILSVDSIPLNGQYFRRFKFSEPANLFAFDKLNEVWLEGIGSIHGPLFPHAPKKFSTEKPDSLLLTCSSTNAHSYWHHPSYHNCFTNIILSTKEPAVCSFNAFPNPTVNGVFVLKGVRYDEKSSIEVVDARGRVVSAKITDLSNMEVQINISTLPKGLYFVKRLQSNGQVEVVKMISQ